MMPSNHLIVCHPLLLLPCLSQLQSLFHGVASLHQVARVLELQHQSFQWIFYEYWFPLGLTGLISVLSETLSRVFSSTTVWSNSSLGSAFFMVQLSCLYMTTGKAIALTRWNFVDDVRSLLFSALSGFVIAFLPETRHLLISWLQSLQWFWACGIFLEQGLNPYPLHWQTHPQPLDHQGSPLPAVDSSFGLTHTSILHDVLCIWVKQVGWQHTALTSSFPSFKPVHCSTSSCNHCFLVCLPVSQETDKAV